jgi:acyl-homoserine-lactone acylase
VDGQRSRFFGPDGTYSSRGNGTTPNNLDSDFFFRRIKDDKVVETLMAHAPPSGPLPQVLEGTRGYVEGYNAYLRETGVDHLPDPRCRGKAWVRPITQIDAFRRYYQLALLASAGVAIDGIGSAQPPTPGVPVPPVPGLPDLPGPLSQLRDRLPLGDLGSNAVALGKSATRNGKGMLLGNPHFPWDGPERFYEAQLTIPGKVNVTGASLFGVPLVLIGHTRHLAWSHTVSTAYRFTPFELKLVPGSPTTYLVDGQPKAMRRQTVTVQARQAGGTVARAPARSTRRSSARSSPRWPASRCSRGRRPAPTRWTTRTRRTSGSSTTSSPSTSRRAPGSSTRSSAATRASRGSTRSPPTRPAGPTTRTSAPCRT